MCGTDSSADKLSACSATEDAGITRLCFPFIQVDDDLEVEGAITSIYGVAWVLGASTVFLRLLELDCVRKVALLECWLDSEALNEFCKQFAACEWPKMESIVSAGGGTSVTDACAEPRWLSSSSCV